MRSGPSLGVREPTRPPIHLPGSQQGLQALSVFALSRCQGMGGHIALVVLKEAESVAHIFCNVMSVAASQLAKRDVKRIASSPEHSEITNEINDLAWTRARHRPLSGHFLAPCSTSAFNLSITEIRLKMIRYESKKLDRRSKIAVSPLPLSTSFNFACFGSLRSVENKPR